jgi:hypothetical protein
MQKVIPLRNLQRQCTRVLNGKARQTSYTIVHKDYVVDLKTTSSIDEFKWNARKYNYDSQAYIYQLLFGKPMMFLVIEKKTGRMGMFTGNEDFYARGKEKMHRAIEVYNKFFGEDSTLDIQNYYVKEEI